MKSRNAMDVIRSGLMLALLCICSLPNLAGAVAPIPTGPLDAVNGTPDYYTTANWANSPPIAKFVDTLPGLGAGKANNLGQYLPVAVPDKTTYPGSDYYIIELREYFEKMHSDLNPTKLRGYVQVDATGADVAPIHYLGPIIVADRDRPVRIKFVNKLPTGSGGDLFIPVDTTVMGSGSGPADASGAPCDNTAEPNNCATYPQNRAAVHLHGGRSPWISDGTPHQWIVPAGEITPFKKGASFYNVPDMPDPGPGAMTYYLTNQQSARLMFYHDHAWGITRLNVYVGEAAGYLITDQYEQDLATRGIIPPDQIPLIIQDKTFVDDTPTTKFVYNPATGLFDTPITVPKVRETDPLWNWGSGTPDANGVRPPVKGDLWLPHVYLPAQSQVAGTGGVNPFGRWMYGPWFYPATVVSKGPVANPYYDPRCSSTNPFELANCQTPGQNSLIPGTPNVSMGMEAFQDSAVVNGTVFPTLTVDPRAYRFRILNAANDRFWNLNFFKADPAQVSPDPRPASPLTEVKMAPASANLATANNWPPLWPVDGRDGGVPDPGTCTGAGATLSCTNFGPKFLQIGTESGFLSQPVLIDQQPITYNIDPTAFWVGNVNKMGLALGPAERADVIVDFSQYAGQTLILYNDAPAAWPAGVVTYDYYTGAPDLRDVGGYGTGGTFDQITGTWVGGTGPLPGYAPNTRTVMQVVVRPAGSQVDGPYTFNQAALQAEFTSAAPATPLNPAPAKTLFERSQEPIIVGQAAYSTAYPNSIFPTNFPWEGIAQINDQALSFVTLAGEKVVVPTEPKGIHDEMGASFDPIYGRMSGNLGMQLPNPTTLNALLVLYGFPDVPTEFVPNSTTVNVQVLPGLPGQPGTVTDGTQIWKINHNGVDTHPIHFHIFDVQLINRVGWDGQILLPEPNELGWKEVVKISPLEDTIIAVRPRAPLLPFGIPNSLRPLNPAIPIDSTMGFGAPIPVGSDWPIPGSATGYGFSSIDWKTGNAYVGTDVPPYPYPNYKGVVTNVMYNFGWEYVWHCHILSHEEMDMMRPIVLNYEAMLPPAFTATATPSGGNVVVNWNDPTPVTYTDLNTYGNPANEIGFNIYRTVGGAFPVDSFTGTPIPLNTSILRANTTSYTDVGASGGDTYIVEAFNAKGSSVAVVGNLLTATVAVTNGPAFTSPGPVNLEASISGVPSGLTVTQVAFYDGATLIGTDTTAPYTLVWNSANVGTHSITARVATNFPAAVVVSSPVNVVVSGTITADFTPADGSSFTVCDTITFTSTSTPVASITGYSWSINGANFTTPVVGMTLPPGTYPVTLAIINSATGETAQVTKTVTIVNQNPTANPGGPYTLTSSGSLVLAGSGTDPNACDTLSYAWDVDNNGTYDYFIANPTITYNALLTVLGTGTHTMAFRVTDSHGGVGTATTTVTVFAQSARMNSIMYPTLQDAYNVAANNSVIQTVSGAATGGFVADRNVTVKLVGGYNIGFTAITSTTNIQPAMTIKQGKIIMQNIKVMPAPLVITTASPLPAYTISSGVYGTTTIAASGGIAPYSFAITAGTQPPGLTLSAAGQLSGTPTTAGTYNFTVTVTDSSKTPVSSSRAFSMDILTPAPLTFTTTSPLPAYSIASGPINVQFAATGGIPPYTFAGAGFTTLGFTFNPNGLMTGTPPVTSVGNWSIPVTVTDSATPPVVTTGNFSLNITL